MTVRTFSVIPVAVLEYVTVELTVPGKLVTVNTERAASRWARHRLTKQWRQAAHWSAKAAKLPELDWAWITVQPSQARGVLADTGNHYPSVKAMIDGLVDFGMLLDDGPKFVKALTCMPPRRGPDGIAVTLIGPARRR